MRLTQVYVDLNDDHIFKKFKLSQLITESKTVIFAPDFLLQVQSQQQLINLLDMAVYIRNVSFFVLVLFYLRRVSIFLDFVEREERVVKISGPWKAAILYVLNKVGHCLVQMLRVGPVALGGSTSHIALHARLSH